MMENGVHSSVFEEEANKIDFQKLVLRSNCFSCKKLGF